MISLHQRELSSLQIKSDCVMTLCQLDPGMVDS